MIKLQSNFTTPEQSRRLLELGVPADSADFFYDLECNNPPHANKVPWFCDDTYSEIVKDFPTRKFIPCWSVGRLIEIANICADLESLDRPYICLYRGEQYIDIMMSIFEKFAEIYMDFSKLEE